MSTHCIPDTLLKSICTCCSSRQPNKIGATPIRWLGKRGSEKLRDLPRSSLEFYLCFPLNHPSHPSWEIISLSKAEMSCSFSSPPEKPLAGVEVILYKGID